MSSGTRTWARPMTTFTQDRPATGSSRGSSFTAAGTSGWTSVAESADVGDDSVRWSAITIQTSQPPPTRTAGGGPGGGLALTSNFSWHAGVALAIHRVIS